jgi:hypothetical protein
VQITAHEKTILRDLAKRLAEIAALPVQQEKAELWRRLNSLDPVRPMIMLQNGTWHETGDTIKMETECEFARDQEWWLRTWLYQWDNIRDDNVYEAKAYSPIAIHDTGFGVGEHATRTDFVFGAACYDTNIPDDADPAMVPLPTITVDRDETERRYQARCELYDGILQVEKRGVGGHWFSIMDQFVTWRGIQQTFTDMCDRPEWVHAWMNRLTEWHLCRLDQLEAMGLLARNDWNVGVGPGGLGNTDELPKPGFDGTHVRARDQWAHATTQIFSEVSPAMHEEFALRYERRFLERFGLAGYGCCEPLDKKLDIVKTIPNLRRVSMSPWVDPARGAAGLGRDYVFSYKPNPEIIAMNPWDIGTARRFLKDALDKARGCVVEVLMKDLHTCRNEPWRMGEWTKMAMELAEEYA